MPLVVLLAALLLNHSAWHPVALAAHDGDVTAVVTYEESNQLYVRNGRLTVLRRGRVLVDGALTGLWDGTISLHFKNVWGGKPSEVLVEGEACGNRCFDQLYVAIPATRRILRADFPSEAGPPWSLERRNGVSEFITDDGRFFCVFSDCASASTPLRVLRIDSHGSRFVDATRSRPGLLLADAKQQWNGYLSERKSRSPYSSLGTLVPWCADEYRLEALARVDYKSTCTHLVPRKDREQIAKWGDWFRV